MLKTFDDIDQALKKFMPNARKYREAVVSLENMKTLMESLGNPQDKVRVIHVAGTSGKTSTTYFIAAFLKAAGLKVGLTVSPHIDHVSERVQINLEPLSVAKFARKFSSFLDLVEKSGVKPTYFEILIAFAYWTFADEKVDYAVIEVGLGGLLDATNVIHTKDKVCVITDIGLDHTEILGQTLPEIASQKAGIIQPYNTVFSYQQGKDVMEVIEEVSRQQNAELHEVALPSEDMLPVELPLYQQRNWYLAEQVYEFVAKRDGLSELSLSKQKEVVRTYIPARMEILRRRGKILVIDGAHNAQKIRALVMSLQRLFPGQKIAILFSQVQSKKQRIRSSLAELADIASFMIVTSFETEADERKISVRPQKLADFSLEQGFLDVAVVDDPKKAYKVLLDRPEPILLITGSFYLLNHIRPIIFKSSKIKT